MISTRTKLLLALDIVFLASTLLLPDPYTAAGLRLALAILLVGFAFVVSLLVDLEALRK